MLTQSQLQAIKTDIANNPDLNTAVSDQAVADLYNLPASPSWYAWNPETPLASIVDSITWANFTPQDAVPVAAIPSVPTEAEKMASLVWQGRSLSCQGKQLNVQTMLLVSQRLGNAGPIVDAAKVNFRAGLQDSLGQLPSGVNGANRNAGWTAVQLILSRQTTRAEKLLSTGAGSQALPAVMGFAGSLSAADIDAARQS